MKNYSRVQRMKFAIAMSVLLLSMVILSGCPQNDTGISGKITSGGSPLPGVTVTLSGDSSLVTTTDAQGNYRFSGVADVTNIITPSLAGYTFRPTNRPVYTYDEDAVGFNFSGFSQSSVAARLHTVYLKNDGTIWTWGSNSNGQLGNGTSGPGTDSNIPVQVPGLLGMTAIAAGTNFTVALKNDGTVWTWGYNAYGQLGNGTQTDSNIPVQVGLSSVIAIAAGYDHTVALVNSSGGTVWTWGHNANGQLGNGTQTDSNIPVQVGGLTSMMAIAAGNAFTVALQSVRLDSQVWAWGSNNNGQLGNGNTTDIWSPVSVSGLSSTGAIGIAAGYDHAVAMKTDGTVWAWGGNSNGQLGNGTTSGSVIPVQVTAMSGAETVAAGEKDTVTLRIDGTVWAWGYNAYGQLGNNSTADSSIPVQALLP